MAKSRFKALRESAKQSARRVKAKLRHAALTTMPIWLTRGRLTRTRGINRFRTVERNVALPDLPDSLDGLTITHLTDLHIGKLITPDRLPAIVEATNALGGDLIAVTGDFIDLSIKVIDPVIDAMRALSAPMGVYFVPGNHDYLDNGPELVRRFKQAELSMLMNESVTLERDGCRLIVCGVDYGHKKKERQQFLREAIRTAPRRRPDDVRILLTHHPDVFDAVGHRHIHLTLAGHTHGGQVVFSNGRSKKGSIGLGSLAHRYPRGLYRRGHAYLYVNSGVGSWFPLRVNCPPEIARLTLRSLPEPGEGLSHP